MSREAHKTIRWQIGVKDLDKKTTLVAFEGRTIMAISFLQTFYLEPLLRFKFLAAGYALVHAATMIADGMSVLLPGGSGVGKTTLMLHQAMRGRPVQGDNYIVVAPSGETLSFPRRSRIYSDLMRTNSAAFSCLSTRDRMRLYFNGLVKTLSFGYASFPARLHLREFIHDISIPERVRLRSIFALTPHQGKELIGPTPLPMENLLEKVTKLNRSEGSRLTQLLSRYLEEHPESSLHRVDDREREILSQAFTGIPTYEIFVPRVENPGQLSGELCHLIGLEDD